MSKTIEAARKKMLDGGYTCVVISDSEEYVSYDRGVKPLLSLLRTERSYQGAVAADKCVGAGAAHLYVLLGVRAVWANVISMPAVEVLQQNGINVFYEQCVPHIINRKGDGICPFEETVMQIQDPTTAFTAILQKMQQMDISLDD